MKKWLDIYPDGGSIPKIIEDFNAYSKSPEGEKYFKMMHDNQRAKQISGRIDYAPIDPITDIALGVGLGKSLMKGVAKSRWYDKFHMGELKNVLPTGNTKLIERGLSSEEAIKDFFNTGIVRNNKSAGLPLSTRSSNYGERVFWGPENTGSIPRNKFTIIAKNDPELANRPVTFNDVQDILIKNEDKTFSSYPGWKESIKKPKKYPDGGNIVARQDATKVVVPKTKRFNQEEYDYYHPVKEKGITSGDWKQDLLYNNQWLLNAPIVGDQIKKQAYKVASTSGGRAVIDPTILNNDSIVHLANSFYKGTQVGYDDSKTNPLDLVSQYFNEDQALPESNYKPKSDYLSFLPSYSIKENFNKMSKGNKNDIIKWSLNDIMNKDSTLNEPSYDYDKFLENKNTIYKNEHSGSLLQQTLGADLGGHKIGVSWDKSVDLPYQSISDAWDFEPNHYSKKWGSDEGSPVERERQLAKVQASLMHKSGKPFKIYDRFYFDPKTQEYISDDSIQSLKKSKGITPLQDEVMNKDYDKYFTQNGNLKQMENGGQLTKLDQLTNFSLYDKSVKGGWLNKYS